MAIELSSTEQEQPSWIIKIILWLSILVLAVVLAIYAYFYFIVSRQQVKAINSYTEAIARQKDNKSGFSENDLRKIEKEISDYKILMQGRAKITKLFPVFEQWVHPQVYFTNFALDSVNRTVTLSGIAQSFQPLIQQVAILKKQPLLERYEISNIAMGETGGVSFSLLLVVKPEVLR